MTSKPGFFDLSAQNALNADLVKAADWGEIASFIGPNAETFRRTWDRMLARAQEGRSPIIWDYCWPALILGFAWYFYRKLWAAGAVMLILPAILGTAFNNWVLSFGVMLLIAMYARCYYLLHALRRIKAVKAAGGGEQAIKDDGGISIPGAVVGGAILLLALAGGVAAALMQGRP